MFSVKRSNRFHLFSLLIMIVGSLVMGIILTLLPTNPKLLIPIQLVFSQVGLVFLPAIFYYIITRTSIKQSLLIRPLGWVNLLICLGTIPLLLPITAFLSLLSQLVFENKIKSVITVLFAVPYPLALLFIAVFPAVFEELSTRFILLNNYRRQHYLLSCLFSGLFFGFLHMNINQFVYAFFLGFIFAFIVQVTGSIFSSVLLHFLINTINFTAGYLVYKAELADNLPSITNISSDAITLQTLLFSGFSVLICLPLLAGLLALLVYVNGKWSLLFNRRSNSTVNSTRLTTHELITGVPDSDSSNTIPAPAGTPATISFWISVAIFLAFVGLIEILPLILKGPWS